MYIIMYVTQTQQWLFIFLQSIPNSVNPHVSFLHVTCTSSVIYEVHSVHLDNRITYSSGVGTGVAGVATATPNLCERILCCSDETAISALMVFLATPLEIIFLRHCTAHFLFDMSE